jgi:hypothetical protein
MIRHLQVTDSDIIDSIGYKLGAVLKSGAYGTLEVVFKSSPDTIYSYESVSADAVIRLITADSIGKMFHELFRTTKYPFTKSQRQESKPVVHRVNQPHMGGEGPKHLPPKKKIKK